MYLIVLHLLMRLGKNALRPCNMLFWTLGGATDPRIRIIDLKCCSAILWWTSCPVSKACAGASHLYGNARVIYSIQHSHVMHVFLSVLNQILALKWTELQLCLADIREGHITLPWMVSVVTGRTGGTSSLGRKCLQSRSDHLCVLNFRVKGDDDPRKSPCAGL